MIQRRHPMKRSGPIKRETRLRKRRINKASDSRQYNRDAAIYLARHPFCQIFIWRHELDEAEVVRGKGWAFSIARKAIQVPRATEIHHRNKRDGKRLLDQRWWMSACREQHDWVEDHKADARALGLLLPIQADEDGRWGDGNQGIETPAFMAKKARRP